MLKENIFEVEEKLTELRRIIQDKEYTIQELEAVQPQKLADGVYLKVKEVNITNTWQSPEIYFYYILL